MTTEHDPQNPPVTAQVPAMPEAARPPASAEAQPDPDGSQAEAPRAPGPGRAMKARHPYRRKHVQDQAPGGDAAGQDPQREAARGRGPARPGQQDDGYRFDDVVSGKLDEDDADASVAPAKRVLKPQPETPKLHKVLAQAGMGSRLEMERLILEGRISVNNEPAHIGQRVQYGDQVKVNGKPIRFRIDPPPLRVIAYHKPAGEVVTNDDPHNRPTVFRKLPRLMQGKWQSVGRLDLNTEGLLLFTSSGDLANRLMHPRFGLEREYAVRVLGALSNEEKQQLRDGVQLDDGMAAFTSIEDGGGEGANCWYRVTIAEGRYREVRRLIESLGHAVSRLIRIRYGAMQLPRGLKRGTWMELDERDIQALQQAVGMPAAPRRVAEQGSGRGGARPGGKRGSQQRAPGANARGGDRNSERGGAAQPDPMKTSVGYIGADSLMRQRQQQRNNRSRRGGR